MVKKTLPQSEAIKFGWNTMKSNIGFFIGLLIVIWLGQAIFNYTAKLAGQRILSREDLLVVTGNSDDLFQNLVDNDYIYPNGIIRDKFIRLKDYSELELDPVYQHRKYKIYDTMRWALSKRPPSKIILYIASLLLWILNFIMGMGLIKIVLKFSDNKKGVFSDLFSSAHLFFKYLLGSILYGLIVLAGAILLIIPGIIWAIQFQFFTYFVIDRELNPIAALKKSSAITKGVKWNLLGFGLLVGLINLAGLLCLAIGLFITVPTTMVAIAFIYRSLAKQTYLIPESETRGGDNPPEDELGAA